MNRRRLKVTSRPLAALSLAATLVAACGNPESQDGSGAGLEKHVCLQEDVPADFRRQTAGDFTPQNLADLGPGPDQRLRQLAAAGMRGGHFAYWKQNVGSPPFEPPLDIICQVIEFDSEANAAAFVQAIRPEPEELATTALTWLPDGSRTVVEAPATLSPGARAFAIRAEDKHTAVDISAVVLPDGRFVRSVYLGGNGGRGTIAEAAQIQRQMAKRLE